MRWRMLALSAGLAAGMAGSARAGDGVFVWNDPQAMAVRMIRFEGRDPAAATAVYTLQELTRVSSTMTGVSPDGRAVGLCRQELDENEAPAWLSGFDARGRRLWVRPAGDFLAALQGALPAGYSIGQDPGWFTFGCADAGAGDAPGVLAFDVSFSAGLPDAKGFVRRDDARDFIGRLHVSGRSGTVLAAALVQDGRSPLVLARNPRHPLHKDPVTGETFALGYEAGFVLPKGGRGQVFFGDRPIRWKGQPIVEGFDFAWYLPQED